MLGRLSGPSDWNLSYSAFGADHGRLGERRDKPACCRGCKSPTGKEVANPSRGAISDGRPYRDSYTKKEKRRKIRLIRFDRNLLVSLD